MVTPSFVMVGAPHFLSMTTLRPFGPSVTLTAFASASTPRSSDLRAESLNSSSLAIAVLRDRDAGGGRGFAPRRGGMVVQSPVPDAPRSHPVAGAHRGAVTAYVVRASADDGENVTGGQDEVLLAAVLDLGAAVLAVDDAVTDLDVERDAVALVVDAAGADCEDLALLGLLLRGVRDDETGRGRLLGLYGLDDDAVFERLDGNRHGGPPLRNSRDTDRWWC